MAEGTPTKFSLIPYLQDHHCTRIKLPSFLPFWIFLYSVLTLSGKFQHGWRAGAGDRQHGGFKFYKRKAYGYIRTSCGPYKSLNWLRKLPADPFIQHHRAVQPLTVIPRPANLDTRLAAQTDYLRKADSKSRPLKYNLFWIWNLVVYSCTNLLFMMKNQICWHG